MIEVTGTPATPTLPDDVELARIELRIARIRNIKYYQQRLDQLTEWSRAEARRIEAKLDHERQQYTALCAGLVKP